MALIILDIHWQKSCILPNLEENVMTFEKWMEDLEKDLFLPEDERKKVTDKYYDMMYYEDFDEEDSSKCKTNKN